MSHILSWVWHTVTKCPKTDLDHTMYGTTHCRGCGRILFVSDTLPKMNHIITHKRTNM